MLFKNIAIIDQNLQVQENMYVGIKDDTISYIGLTEPLENFGSSYNGSGKLLLSGFINSHTHMPMAILRGYAENMYLDQWLNSRIFPFEDLMLGEDIYYSTLLGIAEMLRFGIVSATEMYFWSDFMAQAIIESQVKFNLSRAVICFDDSSYYSLPHYQEAQYLIENYHNANNGKLMIDLSIHGEYTSTPQVVAGLAEHAQKTGLNVHIHLSETQKEHEECKTRRRGMTPAQYFKHMQLFDNPTTAAHCVWIEGEDFEILAEKRVTAATCPISNLKLASGICDIPRLNKNGINIALGTDSVASNNNLNLIEEMKFLSLLSNIKYMDPTLIAPAQVLAAATINGAVAQGRMNTGKLQVGNQADLIVLDIDQPYMKPVHDLLNNLVFSAAGTDVCLTMVDGKTVYKDGEYYTIDLEKATYHVEKSRTRILGELG